MKNVIDTISNATHLSCSQCSRVYDIEKLHTFSPCCNKPLVTNYDFKDVFAKEDLIGREQTMWRYAEMLPLFNSKNKVTLGEGMTPILPLGRLANRYGYDYLAVKDEGLNPTGSFKARGISMAVSKAVEHGVQECVVPTAGNAGGALSAYCAAAGIKATIVMPIGTPKMFQDECKHYGAELFLVDGLINQCGKVAGEIQQKTGAFNMATLKEPYRLEGKKTMGYEIAEQMNWILPDVILYPTGGGTGLLGIWKAFQEMIQLGWIASTKLPRMIAVQTTQCTPIVDTYNNVIQDSDSYKMSIANGLSVPHAFGEDMIMRVLKESNGSAIAVSDQQILAGVAEISSSEGILISPEGAAIWEALKMLTRSESIRTDENILLLNTGSGYKYMENLIPKGY